MKLGKGVRSFVECRGSFGETPPVYKDFAQSAWAATTPPPRLSVSRYGFKSVVHSLLIASIGGERESLFS
jgi:hypothetical protein